MVEVQKMAVSYDNLWKLLIDKKINRTELKDLAGISFNVLARMGKNEFVSMESIYKICSALHCDIEEVMEFTIPKDEKSCWKEEYDGYNSYAQRFR